MAAVGLGQLERYHSLLDKRRKIIEYYNSAFKGLNIDAIAHYTDTVTSSGHLYLMRLIGKDSEFRNNFIIKMAESGIACNVHYKPLPMHTAYKKLGFDISNYPNAYNQFTNEVTLPLHTLMSMEDVKYVTENVIKLMGE